MRPHRWQPTRLPRPWDSPGKNTGVGWHDTVYPNSNSHPSSLSLREPLLIGAFELWCWRRLLRVPWIVRRSSHSILKEINSEYSLEGLMLKLQYFTHLMCRANSLEKTLMLGKTEGKRRRGQQRMRWLDSVSQLNGHELEQTPWDGGGEKRLACCSPRNGAESDTTEQLNHSNVFDNY